VPLVVAVLGVLGTVVAGVIGVVITQRWSDRREAKTAERERQREQERWERERERERERWAREDVARTFDRRSASYLDFYSAVGQEYLSLMEVFSRRRWHSEPDAHAPDEVRDAVFKTLEEVRVYGSQTVVETAEEIFDHLALTESEPTTAKSGRAEGAWPTATERDSRRPRSAGRPNRVIGRRRRQSELGGCPGVDRAG
jgi:hypothetical protein